MLKIIFYILLSLSFSSMADEQLIMCFGDSITHKGKWLDIVNSDPAFKTINAGKSGRRASQAKASLSVYLKKHRDFDKLIIFLGVNDLPARDKRPGNVKVALCVENISETVDLALKTINPENIILIGPCSVNPKTMSEMNLKKGYNITSPLLLKLGLEYEKLAKKKGLHFLSLYKTVSPENFKDGLHPNEAGDKEIAKEVLSFLKKL